MNPISWLKRHWACRNAGPHCCDGWPNEMIVCPGRFTKSTPLVEAIFEYNLKKSKNSAIHYKPLTEPKNQRIVTGADLIRDFKDYTYTLEVPVYNMVGEKIVVHRKRRKK